MSAIWVEHLESTLADMTRNHLRRQMKVVQAPDGPEALLDGRPVLMFCTNDYLGYNQHPELKKASSQAIETWGVGSGASRLISGNLALYETLEQKTARFKHADDAIVFSTGYMTNLGVVAGLAGPEALIVSDALNHASLVDACRLSRAEVRIVPHADVGAMARAVGAAGDRRVLLVTDGVFSMDGDIAPLGRLAEVADRENVLLVVDDAHGTGVLGARGRGTTEYCGIDPSNIVQIGTFSKALGGLGGFVAGPRPVIDFLKSRARTLFYTTGLPPSVLAANVRALELVDEEPETRTRLHHNTARLRQGLGQTGLDLIPGPSAIVPLMVGEASLALDLAKKLLDRGLFCPAIRPPTVPPGQSRIRLSVMATHTEEHIDRAVHLVSQAAKEVGLC